MYIVNEYGAKVHLPDETLPESMTQWAYANIKMVEDDTELEECWVAQVNKKPWPPTNKDAAEFVGERVYDHSPTKEELIWLMCEYDALRYSYVSVVPSWRLKEKYD